jgi:hypothetical protein
MIRCHLLFLVQGHLPRITYPMLSVSRNRVCSLSHWIPDTRGPLPPPLTLKWYKVTRLLSLQCSSSVFLSRGLLSRDSLSRGSMSCYFLSLDSMPRDFLSHGSMSSDSLSRGSMSSDFLSRARGSMPSISYPVVQCQVFLIPWFNVM